MAITKVNEFMAKIGVKGGMSLTTGFNVKFEFNNDFAKEFYKDDDEQIVNMFCDEAQLPNVQSATGGMQRFLGEGTVQYPHTRIFTDVGLGFLCDADMTAFKFFHNWYNHIYGDDKQLEEVAPTMAGALGAQPLKFNRENRLKYMDEYVSTCKIIKSEPDAMSSSGRVPVVVMLENCYPYALDAVPLSYGTSQVTRINVNLYYSRHSIVYGKSSETTSQQPETATQVFDRTGRLPPG